MKLSRYVLKNEISQGVSFGRNTYINAIKFNWLIGENRIGLISQGLGDYIEQILTIKKDELVVIPNGIDTGIYLKNNPEIGIISKFFDCVGYTKNLIPLIQMLQTGNTHLFMTNNLSDVLADNTLTNILTFSTSPPPETFYKRIQPLDISIKENLDDIHIIK